MTIRFTKSNKLRNKLILTQEEQFRRLFKKAFKLIQEKIITTGLHSSKGNLSGIYVQKLKSLSKFIVKSYSELIPKIESVITDNLFVVTESVVKEFERKSNTDIKDSKSFVQDIVSSVILGHIYDTNWTLHKAVSNYPKYIKKLVDTIIQDGITDGKSAEEITDTILDVLDPSAPPEKRKYVAKSGMAHTGKIDADVQKIAKTTLVHDYERAVISTAMVLEGRVFIRWISALAPNTCELCEQRHNQLYEPEDVPLEHPNGQCELQIEIL